MSENKFFQEFFYLVQLIRTTVFCCVTFFHTARDRLCQIQGALSLIPEKMMNFTDFFNFDPKKLLKKKMNFFRNRQKSSKVCPKMLRCHTKVFLHFSDYVVGSIYSFQALQTVDFLQKNENFPQKLTKIIRVWNHQNFIFAGTTECILKEFADG